MIIRRFFGTGSLIAAIALLPLLALSVTAQDSRERQGRPKLAVLGVEATAAALSRAQSEGVADGLALIADGLDGQLIAALSNTRKFTVVARSDLEKLLDDADLQQVFARDPVQALSMLGTQYGVLFRIDGYRDEYVEQLAQVEGRGSRVARARRSLFVSVVATVYDIEAGTALESVATEYEATPLRAEWGAVGAERAVVREMMAGALDGVAKELARDVTRTVLYRIFPARVALVESGQAYLSWGDGTPIEAGQEWDIFDVTRVEDIDFPGEYMEIERVVGRVRVDSVSPTNSAATVLEDLGIERGAIARLDEAHERERHADSSAGAGG